MVIKVCEKCHKPITCPLDACVCHAIKAEREKTSTDNLKTQKKLARVYNLISKIK